MLTPENFADALSVMGFVAKGNLYTKEFPAFDTALKADVKAKKLFYPDEIKGRERNNEYGQDANGKNRNENLVVFECVHRLLEKGYRPEHIELEKEWHLGHDAKSGRADICVTDDKGKMLFIIECKTAGREYKKEFDNMRADGGQLFSYWQQEQGCEWLILYASDYEDGKITYKTESVDCHDDENIKKSAKRDDTVKLYQNAYTTEALFSVWDETYEKRLCGDVVLREDTVAYKIGTKPLRKADLKDFAENDKIVNRFEEILRHNNVSDKENAFNRLVALFICKLVDEIQKNEKDETEFQYKVGTDTYESLQDRLQRLHRDGMKDFMREDIFYVEEGYADKLVKDYTGHNRRKMINDLKTTLRKLKFYTNNDFAFKDVHNEELFYQNGKILVEVVQLFENYRIIGASDLQTLGDLFEQLLAKGFKQNEGQFFTPVPLCRFMWDSLPLDALICREHEAKIPKIVDYACGAGHFLSEGFAAVNDCLARHGMEEPSDAWEERNLYGIEKDYRLARVSKIALFMHGAGKGNIIFGDGLENYRDKNILPNTFDILVANPPYAVSAFKQPLTLKDNDFSVLDKITHDGSEIETLFVERIAQLVKPLGVAAVILPSSILNKENGSFIAARESLLTNFYIRAIAQFGSKTFGATGTNTVVMFLQKFDEPPKRIDLVADSVEAIKENRALDDWADKEIFEGYLAKIGVGAADYREFLSRRRDYDEWDDVPYFVAYAAAFLASAEYTTKAKQRSFIAAAENEQRLWCNAHFYDFAIARESEKLTFFALCYRQTTLIISAPDDNKGQEDFLGYTWSNRKGQEGIQIKKEGGLMYRPDDRTAEDTLAALVRGSFTDEEKDAPALSSYYYYLPLTDMLDFSGVEFNKAIKINRSNYVPVTYTGKYPLAQVGEAAPYVTDRVNISDIQFDSYITTDNMLKDKQGVTAYEGTPQISSVTKYLKEDILVSNIRPYLKKIWFADREGGCSNDILVFRSQDKKKLLPAYLFTVLSQDAFFDFMMANAKGMKMPRGDKNSIPSYEFPLPPIAAQKEIVDVFHAIDKKIQEQEETVRKCDEDIKAKFVEMFGDLGNNTHHWKEEKFKDICEVITDGEHNTPRRVSQGIYLLSARNILNHSLQLEDVDYIDEEEYQRIAKRIVPKEKDVLISCSGTIGRCCIAPKDLKFQMVRSVALLRFKTSVHPVFAEYMITSDYLQKQIAGSVVQQAQPNLFQGKIKELRGPVPPIDLQNKFVAFVEQHDKAKRNAQKRKEALLAEREQAIAKYFR